MTAVQAVEEAWGHLDCFTDRCDKEGCGVNLEGAPHGYVIVDFDMDGSPLGQRDRRCDYLFVADEPDRRGWVVPIELTTGKKSSNDVREQLQAGARVVEQILDPAMPVAFRPVFGAPARKVGKFLWRELRQIWIRFHDKRELPRVIECGDRLTDAL